MIWYECDLCCQQFKRREKLEKHLELHIHEISNIEYEPTEITRKSNLSKHMQAVYSGERPYKCGLCRFTFTQKSCFNRHIREIHEGECHYVAEHRYECLQCGIKLSQKSNLN